MKEIHNNNRKNHNKNDHKNDHKNNHKNNQGPLTLSTELPEFLLEFPGNSGQFLGLSNIHNIPWHRVQGRKMFSTTLGKRSFAITNKFVATADTDIPMFLKKLGIGNTILEGFSNLYDPTLP